jgi:predicted nucleotide-binding protein (sugar kinase/HSP70/actin superfamily)
MIEKLRLRTRPYEADPGRSDRLFARYIQELCADVIPEQARLVRSTRGMLRLLVGRHTEPLEDLLRRARRDFAAIPRRDDPDGRPLVGVVGEWFVRLHDGANQHIVRKLETAGAETWLAPAGEFFSYSIRIGGLLAWDRWRDTRSSADLKLALTRALLSRVALRDEHHLSTATEPYLDGLDDIGPDQIIGEGSRYIHPSFGGEPICSMGKAIDFARRRIDGIVNVIPFNCMPGNTVVMLSHAFRRDHDNIPWLNLDYDGFVDAGRDAKIASFMSQVKERRAARRQRAGTTAPGA